MELVPFNQNISPLAPLATALCLGITAQFHYPIAPMFLITSILFSCIAITQNTSQNKNLNMLISLYAVYCIGGLLILTQQEKHYLLQSKLENKKISIQGTVTAIDQQPHARFKHSISISVSAYKIKKDPWQKISTTIILQTSPPEDWIKKCNIDVGDTIQLFNIYTSKANTSFNQYLIKEGVGTYIFCTQPNIRIIEHPTYSFSRAIHHILQQIQLHIQKHLSKEAYALFSTLFLGKKIHQVDANTDIADQFRLWGISHFLARSGMHLSIFILVCFAFLRFIPARLFFKQLLTMLICFTYFLLSSTSISFIRAFSTTTLFFICNIKKRKVKLLHITLRVFICFLITNPIALFFLDFELSFLFTLGLAWLIEREQKIFQK